MAKLLSSLPIGASIKFGKHSVNGETAQPIVWVVADKNHSGYPSGAVTLLSKQVIDLRAYDAEESPYNYTENGNINYALSNLNQWLNSDASEGQWYSPTHDKDTPPNQTNVQRAAEYYTRPGFLYNFASSERAALLPTTIKVDTGSGTYTTITPKVFIPSTGEFGMVSSPTDGSSVLAYISQFGGVAPLTNQAYQNSTCTEKRNPPNNTTQWTRNPSTEGMCYALYESGSSSRQNPYWSAMGVRTIINLAGSMEVSTTTDSEGCYTFSLTNAPTAPTNVQILTSKIYTTKPCSIKWNGGTDPNGDVLTYRVNIYYDGVISDTPVDVGTATTYTLPSVKSGVSSIGFSVEAVDPMGHSSTSTTVTGTAYTNKLPTISGADSNKGITDEFVHSYTISDADGEAVTVKEYIDNVMIRSYVATPGATNTFPVTGMTWLKLTNGIHTMKITATDGVDTATRLITFTKSLNTLVVQRVTPLASATKPTRLVVTVVKNIPPEATFKVEACNNGFDAAPTWEDVTSSITSGQTHVFANTAKTADKWGVNIRVTINRNGGAGACYITEIGGNFE